MKNGTVYFKRSARSKRIRITVRPAGAVVVTFPPHAPISSVERFVKEKMYWIQQKLDFFKTLPTAEARHPSAPRIKEHYLAHKEAARILVHERLSHFSRFYTARWNKVTIRNQRSRWGSCSRSGNLNFNYKILFLDKDQQDYIIVHELCHLKELNHGKQFWGLVKEQIPEYKKIRKSVRTLIVKP